MRRSVLTCLTVAAVASVSSLAGANGRPAANTSINFQQGSAQHIVAGSTFGFLRSDDGGTTWKWMCDAALENGGTFDPDYAYTPTGTVFATTIVGLKVMRDGCTFASAPSGNEFVSSVEMSPNGNVLYAAADPADGKIYESTTDGTTFGISGSPGQANDWWDSLVVAPSDATRRYVSGYRYIKQCTMATNNGTTCTMDTECTGVGAKCSSIKVSILSYSDNGTTWTPMSQTGLTLSNLSTIDVVGVDHALKDTLYIHINLENGSSGGDSIYKSVTKGANWTKILTTNDAFGLYFLAKADGTLVAATSTSGSQKSVDGGTSWTPLANAPHINCLVENPATHEVWACTHNFDSPGIPMDGYGIMKTSDLVTWTGVLHYQNINGVVDCAAGTVQHDQCVASYQGRPSVWCCLEAQLGITDTSVDCTGPASCDITPDGGGADNTQVKVPKGCCQTGGGGAGFALLALGTGALLWRRRRR